MPPQDQRLFAGLDIGGTKIGVSIGTADGTIVARDRLETDRDVGPAVLLDQALAKIEALADAAGARPFALGMACPGPLSYEHGMLLEVPNMPRWQRFPIRAYAAERFPGEVAMMNDANASMLAEHLFGAAREVTNAVFLTMSTGMGAGLLLDGRVYEGPRALAGEVGHMRLRDDGPVGFGKRGSVEGYLSGPGICQLARAERLAFSQRGAATALAPDDDLTVEQVCALAAAGDLAAVRVIDRVGHELGRLCAWLVDLLNPERIILDTIGAAWPDLFLPRARRVIDEEAIPASAACVELVPSSLSDRGNQTAIAVALQAGMHR